MKKRVMLAVILGVGMILSGCSSESKNTTQPATVAPATVADSTNAGTSEKESANADDFKAEGPVLITSAGQSADFEMIKVMFDKNELTYSADSVATEEALGDCKTLVVAIGGSSKGLGAAGIDADAELERVKKLLTAADEKGITIIAAHIGGSGRRGKLGDRYIEPTVSMSDYTIVVKAGNEDGLFTTLSEKYSIPMTSVENMTDVIPVIGKIFD